VAEHVGVLRSSRSSFIQELFAESEADSSVVSAGGKPRHTTKSAFKLNSVGAQFRKQLQVCHSEPTPAGAAAHGVGSKCALDALSLRAC
jgi:hypothetical protein